MGTRAHKLTPRYLALSTRLFLAFVVVLGLFSFLQAPEASRSYGVEFSRGGWTVLVLFLVSLTNVTVTRLLVLPNLRRRQDATLDRIAFTGYSLAITPSIYGLAGAILTGEGWVSLPFTLLSLFALVDLRFYVAALDEQGPR